MPATLDWDTMIPLHLNAVYEGLDTSGTYPSDPITGISDDSSADEEAETSRIQSQFQWDFGDGSPVEAGFNVAHVFRASSDPYTVTLTITNPTGMLNYTSFQVNVSTHIYLHTYYVSENGTGGGTSSTDAMSISSLQARLTGGSNVILSNSQILFERGSVFYVGTSTGNQFNGTLTFSSTAPQSDMYFGPDPNSSGADPLFEKNVSNDVVGNATVFQLNHADSQSDIIFDGLDFYNADATDASFGGFDLHGVDVAVENCDFNNLGDSAGEANAIDCESSDGVYINGNTTSGSTSDPNMSYFVYGANASDEVISNNNVDLNTGGNDAVIRISGAKDGTGSVPSRILIANNILQNLTSDAIRLWWGQYDYVTNNLLTVSNNMAVDVAAFNTNYPVGNVVIERNQANDVSPAPADGNDHIRVAYGSKDVMIRNNILNMGGSDLAVININGNTNSSTTNLFILNNTGIIDDRTDLVSDPHGDYREGSFIWSGGFPASHVAVENNVFIVTADDYEIGANQYFLLKLDATTDLSDFAAIGHNIWADEGSGGDPVVQIGSTDLTEQQWADPSSDPSFWSSETIMPQDDTFANVDFGAKNSDKTPDSFMPLDDIGTASPAPGVFSDFYGHPRPTSGPWTAGAVEVMPAMAGDIDPGRIGTAFHPATPGDLVNVNVTLYLPANDGIHGWELYKSDGQFGGTVLVKDINPTGDSDPWNLTAVGSELYFTANDGTNGIELWKSDGTEAGTVMVADINPAGDSDPSHLTVVNGELFFVADDGTHGPQLWESDGTSGGTKIVQDINPAGSSGAYPMAVVGGELYFTASDDGSSTELWATDGTTTTKLENFTADGLTLGTSIAMDGSLYLIAGGGSSGNQQLWKATPTGANEVAEIPGTSSDPWWAPIELVPMDGKVYFTVINAPDGDNLQLWSSDGTAAETIELCDIGGDAWQYNPFLTAVGNNLYFVASSDPSGLWLWTSDGTAAGSQAVTNSPEMNGESPEFTAIGSTVYFIGSDSTNGRELWETNGISAGIVSDINPGSASSNPDSLMNVNGTLYFTAYNASSGTELWRTDGTPGGTVMVADLASGSASSSPVYLTVVNDELFFSARDSDGNSWLWELYVPSPS